MNNLLEVDSVGLEFGSNIVLQGAHIRCESGKVTGLLGRNGSGKSCLMKIIYGELATDAKSIKLNGKMLLNSTRKPEDMMYLSQNSYIPKSLKISRIFNDFNLDFSEFTDDFPEFEKFYYHKLGRLSGGEQRIIEIYAILAAKTKICMLDEPFSMVMPVHVAKIKNIIEREKRKKGIIITDHLYHDVLDMCDYLYVMKDGWMYLAKDLKDLAKYGYIRN